MEDTESTKNKKNSDSNVKEYKYSDGSCKFH